MTLILFTTVAPHPLTNELSHQGHSVHEALAVSEVLALVEQHPTATILIAADVDQERSTVIKERYSTLRLNRDATVQDILWELNLKGPSVQ